MRAVSVCCWDPLNALRELVLTKADFICTAIGVYYLQLLVQPIICFVVPPCGRPGRPCLLGRRLDRAHGRRALLVGWPLVTYVFLAGVSAQNPRYAMALRLSH
jgi:hypothetical protein